MLLHTRCYWHPKDLGYAKEYEDAFCFDPRGSAAIADGVSSAIFSRQWAEILTLGVVQEIVDCADTESFKSWLMKQREEWARSINFSSLNFFQQQKLQEVGGAYATLLCIKLTPLVVDEQPETEYRLEAHGLGDCCAFVVRGGEVVWRFPLETTAEFDADPLTLSSRNRQRDNLVRLKHGSYQGHIGDLVVLSSDALAKWIFQRIDAQESVHWDEFWQMNSAAWAAKVAALRDLPLDVKMRVDDTTLLMLQTTAESSLAFASPDASNLPQSSSIVIVSPQFESAPIIAVDRIFDSRSAMQLAPPIEADEELLTAEPIDDEPSLSLPIADGATMEVIRVAIAQDFSDTGRAG